MAERHNDSSQLKHPPHRTLNPDTRTLSLFRELRVSALKPK